MLMKTLKATALLVVGMFEVGYFTNAAVSNEYKIEAEPDDSVPKLVAKEIGNDFFKGLMALSAVAWVKITMDGIEKIIKS